MVLDFAFGSPISFSLHWYIVGVDAFTTLIETIWQGKKNKYVDQNGLQSHVSLNTVVYDTNYNYE